MDLPAPFPPGLSWFPQAFSGGEAADFHEALLQSVPWEVHSFVIFGKTVPMPRRIQMFGPFGYSYSGVDHPPRPLLPLLDAIRIRVEALAGVSYNSVLVNHYRSGSDSMGWHQDNDYPCDAQPTVASVSLGATRVFRFRHRVRKGASVGLPLVSGSVLVMAGEALTEWQHALPRSSRVQDSRINLTFRWMTGPSLRASGGGS